MRAYLLGDPMPTPSADPLGYLQESVVIAGTLFSRPFTIDCQVNGFISNLCVLSQGPSVVLPPETHGLHNWNAHQFFPKSRIIAKRGRDSGQYPSRRPLTSPEFYVHLS